MSTAGDLPGLPGSELDGDDDAVFDELARRAGAALRRPAPADGVRAIAAGQRRQQALKASVVGGVAVALLITGLVIVSTRDDPDRLPPVDSVLATIPTPTAPAPMTTSSVPVDSVPATIPTSTPNTLPPTVPTPLAAVPSLWVELEPGATAPLPPAPIPAHNGSTLVWTGTELIVWGGIADDQPCCSDSQDGAAFDPAAGTWRQIAPPPDGVRSGTLLSPAGVRTGEGVSSAVVLWTGTEMLVWGDGTPDTASAAYDPANDTWRLIADPPNPGSAAFWIGEAAVFLGDPSLSSSSFAYDQATDEWRPLADGPWGLPAVWTGTTIITVTDTEFTGPRLSGYDPATDTWRLLEELDFGEQPVVIPGRGGAAATVAFLPGEPGTPVELLDDRGTTIDELAGRPPEFVSTCLKPPGNTGCILTSMDAVSVGGEVLFWYSGSGWSFDLEAQTWRSFPLDGRQPIWDGTEVVAAGDLLFAWGADRDGLVYRAATPG